MALRWLTCAPGATMFRPVLYSTVVLHTYAIMNPTPSTSNMLPCQYLLHALTYKHKKKIKCSQTSLQFFVVNVDTRVELNTHLYLFLASTLSEDLILRCNVYSIQIRILYTDNDTQYHIRIYSKPVR